MTFRVLLPQRVVHFVGSAHQDRRAAPWGGLQELDDEGAVEEREGTCDDRLNGFVKGGKGVV